MAAGRLRDVLIKKEVGVCVLDVDGGHSAVDLSVTADVIERLAAEFASSMKCLKPFVDKKGNAFNCGQCINCRVNRTTAWKLRLMMELQAWRGRAVFVTLNYKTESLLELADEGMPFNSLSVREAQLYVKRLRKSLASEYGTDGDGKLKHPIKYYIVGEYGSKRKRAHYHAIIFGLDIASEVDRDLVARAWLPRCEPWQFDIRRRRKCAIQPVVPESIEYVCGYVQKKITGKAGEKEYGERQPPFMICSQGLGLDIAKDDYETLKKGWTFLPNGRKVAVPRYFREKMEIDLQLPDENEQRRERYLKEQDYARLRGFETDGLPFRLRTQLNHCLMEQRQAEVARARFEDKQQLSKIKGVF